MDICKIKDCNNVIHAKGLCNKHYRRYLKYGNPLYTSQHHKSRTSIYKTWDSIMQRCLNPNASNYKNYGGRGIEICERWLDFKNFYKDMGDRPKGMQINRINNEGNYESNNCQWVTNAENSRNKRTTKLTEWIVRKIRFLYPYLYPKFSRDKIARHFKISTWALRDIINYKTWRGI